MENNSLKNQIRANMQLKETDELLDIWQRGDPAEWSPDAFEIVKEILLLRIGEIPARQPEKAKPSPFLTSKIKREKGRKKMLYGALWCIGGIVVTAVTYSTALVRGGTYYLFWGAILFGFLQFFQGLFQFLDAPKQDINISKAEELVFIIETDKDWMKQLDAAEALARLKDTRGLDYLKKSLESSNADVREVAREILDELSNISDQTVKPKST